MVSLWQLFSIFAKIGAFTIGGGYAMIPLIEEEFAKKSWISEQDVQDVIVLAQSAPGIIAVNLAVFAGYKMRGVKGSVTAAIGAVLPSFIIILTIAMFFTHFRDNKLISSFMQGIRPAAVGLILAAAASMAKRGCKAWWAWAVATATLIAVAFLRVSPIWIILAIIAGVGSFMTIREGRE